MSRIDTVTDPTVLADLLEECDAAFAMWDHQGFDPLPDVGAVRCALERVHRTARHPLADRLWEEAYRLGCPEGLGRIAREYGRIVRRLLQA